MRTAFIDTLLNMARLDSRIMLVVGDLGFGVVTSFRDDLPDQFVNAGVAEQNMTGMAVGMALSGKIVFTYSIANFSTVRPLEQIRNDVCYHQANVCIVAVGGGLSYGALGASHHATEDLALMRALPNLMVVAPGDPIEAREATRALISHQGPAYLRLGRAGEPVVHNAKIDFELGKAIKVRDGSDVALITTGGMLHNAVRAADQLEKDGIQAAVLSMHTVKPLDQVAVIQAATDYPAVFTIEEHNIIGGLGSAVAETLAEQGTLPCLFKRIGIDDRFVTEVGDQKHLLAYYGLDANGIVQVVKTTLANRSKSR